MAYLTFEEFQCKSIVELTQEEFDKLLPRASDLLDYLTSYFYVDNDMRSVIPWINDQFKKALVAQIEYFHEAGETSYKAIHNKPQSFGVGRTTVTNTQKQENLNQHVPKEVYTYLSGTGLLFGGVDTL